MGFWPMRSQAMPRMTAPPRRMTTSRSSGQKLSMSKPVTSMILRQALDRLAYDPRMSPIPDAIVREWQRMLRALAGVPPGALVLDIACGDGLFAARLVGAGWKVVGADVATETCEAARLSCAAELAMSEKALDDVARFGAQDPRALTFDDGAFDAVACHGIFEVERDADARRAILAQLARVSKGPIVLTYDHRLSLEAMGSHPPPNALRYSVLRREIASAGLVPEEVHPVRFLVAARTI